MQTEILVALIAGAFGVGGAIIGAGLTILSNYLEDKRKNRLIKAEARENEQAILHGAFAVTNFINERLNDWDSRGDFSSLLRLSIVQTYVSRLIDRSPPNSERLMIALVDLGIRLEALMFLSGLHLGGGEQPEGLVNTDVHDAIEELAAASEVVGLILGVELPIIDEADLTSLLANQRSAPNSTNSDFEAP